MNHCLKYASPAKDFNHALPLGNGHIGAMVYGGVAHEKISVNEATLWSGFPSRDTVNGSPAVIEAVRKLMLENKFMEATELLETEFSGFNTQYYLPLGNLLLDNRAGTPTTYLRCLDLSRAVHTTEASGDGFSIYRESFISHPHRVLAMKIKQHGCGETTLRFESQLNHTITVGDDHLLIQGVAPVYAHHPGCSEPYEVVSDDAAQKGMRYAACVSVVTDGVIKRSEDGLVIADADEICVYFAARTSFVDYKTHPYTDGAPCLELVRVDIQTAKAVGYDALLKAHVDDYAALYQRTAFSVAPPNEEYTDVLLKSHSDPARFELLFNMGKYLSIASSREGGQPSTLQGLWNELLFAPWHSNYTININTQMNYLPTMRLGLKECFEPYVKLVEELADTGATTAKTWYGVDGITVHHNTDLWRLSSPVSYKRRDITCWSFFNMTYGWLLWGLYDKYLLEGDIDFLRDTLYPLIIKFAETLLQLFYEDEDGYLFPFPSTSPENHFVLPDGTLCALSRYTTISNAISRDVFWMAAEASDVLGYMQNAERYRAYGRRIMPYHLGGDGRVMEWAEGYPESDPHHRHVSQLYGLHPAREISPETTPELAEACRKTLDARGDGGTGWCIAWKANMWARLRDGDRTLQLLENQLQPVDTGDEQGGTYPNFLCAHPPFQIDGNFGATAAILEMLVQCDGNTVYVLPALPSSWRDGYVKGVAINGGATIDIVWKNGVVKETTIHPETLRDNYTLVY